MRGLDLEYHDAAEDPNVLEPEGYTREPVLSHGEGGKEAKRHKSEPTTPISTSSKLPHEYDEVMGITQVDPREAERFEEGLDSEYHDATEEPPDTDRPEPEHMPCFSYGG